MSSEEDSESVSICRKMSASHYNSPLCDGIHGVFCGARFILSSRFNLNNHAEKGIPVKK